MAVADTHGVLASVHAFRLGRIFPRTLLALILGLALGGCTPAPPEPLRIAAGQFAGYEPLYLARDLGLLDEDTVRLVEYAPGSQTLRAYRNGVVDGAALTLDEVLILAREGYNPRILATLSFSQGVDMVVARPEVESLAGLRGRRIGVENTALGAYFLSRVLFFAGIDRDEVTVVPMELAEHPQAFREGRADALITYNLSPRQLDEMGAIKLFDSSSIPGEIVDVLIVRARVLERAPEAVNALVAGWTGAMNHIAEHPRDAAVRMAPRLRMSPDEFRENLTGLDLPEPARNLQLLSGDPPPLQTTMEDIKRFMISAGLLPGPVDLSGLIEPAPLAAALESP
ncbi:nitrate/sulfonate/bicarbonate ABC transporter [Thioalkalivibrio denitrificans]|uniref:Nitrate/sulfonate/bicarbonate ABC transporter n=1 Tax=Thioalkalivibrio denitrificans TaxID=108003 RepID=A0A1V3N900_9GAMM|nr:ABC transporter substrate-binding protein [Thioalkalivibrio denitrificans]OOG21471.1 nitrate/sulfonate/bicarbonate ABC transporter [Thioalkalivibrio denitrificans]